MQPRLPGGRLTFHQHALSDTHVSVPEWSRPANPPRNRPWPARVPQSSPAGRAADQAARNTDSHTHSHTTASLRGCLSPLPSLRSRAAPAQGPGQAPLPQPDTPLLCTSHPTTRPPVSVNLRGTGGSLHLAWPFSLPFGARQTASTRWDRPGQRGGLTGVVGSVTPSTPGGSSVGNFSSPQFGAGAVMYVWGPSFPN